MNAALLTLSLLTVSETDPKGTEYFERHIRPVLVERCFDCHSGTKAKGGLRLDRRDTTRRGGDSGPAIVPGDARRSLLLEAISYADESLQMPPKGKLAPETIAHFRRWIELGAPDPRVDARSSVDEESAETAPTRDFWAFRRPVRSPPPPVSASSWPMGDIDRFILARLERAELAPRREADRATLLRRVSFDLTGLPPDPRELDAFLRDPSPRAFESVVDRLLASPEFGVHWARRWFDLSCYADLGDIDGNVVLRGAWRYRDYVVSAFNEDRAIDRFIEEQIAGDLLPLPTVRERREAIIATGFLAIGPWTLQNYIKGQLHADVVDHQIEKIGRTFLGLSVGCARCHDHKFDPIPTRDYYALAGIFHSTLTTRHDGPGVWSTIVRSSLPETPEEKAERRRRDESYEASVEKTRGARLDLEEERGRLFDEILDRSVASSMNVLERRGLAANRDGEMYEVSFDVGPTVWANAGQATTERDGVCVEIIRGDGSVLAAHSVRPGRWRSGREAQTFSRVSFSYRGDGSGDVGIRFSPSLRYAGRFGGAVDRLRVTSGGSVVFADQFDDYRAHKITGTQAHTALRVFASGEFPGWTGGGINHSHAVERASGDYAIQLFGGGPPSLADHPAKTDAEKRTHARINEIEREIRSIPSRVTAMEYGRPGDPHALAVRDVAEPRDSAIYIRGDFRNRGEIIPRGFLSSVLPSGSPIAAGTSGRRELAAWLVHPENPLTARVLVNRVWHHIFGQGIVRTVDDFGVHGDRPSHPELLDTLAVEFIESGWSLKTLVRRLVLSRTYRTASERDTEAELRDPDNRLLWRMPRRRLEAESIRDALLAVSGELDRGRGGPSLGLDLPGNVAGIGGNVNPPTYTSRQLPKSVEWRRSLYLPLHRRPPAGPLEILNIFDFPHPNSITGRRAETTVATQALFMMNSPFVKDRARAAARRILAEPLASDRARVERLFLLAFGRRPDENDLESSLKFLDEIAGATHASSERREEARTEAWVDLCHAVLASNAFLFRD